MTLTKAPRVAQKKFSEFKNFYYIRRQKTDDLGPHFDELLGELRKFNFLFSYVFLLFPVGILMGKSIKKVKIRVWSQSTAKVGQFRLF